MRARGLLGLGRVLGGVEGLGGGLTDVGQAVLLLQFAEGGQGGGGGGAEVGERPDGGLADRDLLGPERRRERRHGLAGGGRAGGDLAQGFGGGGARAAGLRLAR